MSTVPRVLNGNLEDLDLDEMVRVVALSRRSGTLSIDAAEGKAELTFAAGRLVRARAFEATETLGQLLIRVGVIERVTVSVSVIRVVTAVGLFAI